VLGKGVYSVKFIHLNGSKNVDSGNWLLRISRNDTPKAKGGSVLDSARLTGRESEICDLAREGLDDREIAVQLYISPHTVKAHLKKIHEKLDVHTRAQLIAVLNR
jgi:DNA-binding CsgD family transcriptional regulator